MQKHDDDLTKGTVETDKPAEPSQVSMAGQLPHRTEDARVKGQDTDFPEPGENPEHSGQDANPGLAQKQNQNQQKDDPLAA
jgi:hypothetical protein